MDVAYVSAFAALTGSVVGGLMSGIATWLAQRSQVQAGYRAHQISLREDLFRAFIAAASKAHGQALMSNRPELQELVGTVQLGQYNAGFVLPADYRVRRTGRERDHRNLLPAEQDVRRYTRDDQDRYRDQSVERIRRGSAR
jgi:hypothetical protein